jgi:hypothetical protein
MPSFCLDAFIHLCLDAFIHLCLASPPSIISPTQMASPHHRHQSSLEGVINFSNKSPLGVDERAQAKRRFYHIVNHFEATDDGSSGSSGTSTRYNRPLLIRLTYEYARSEVSQDGFLQAFFQTMALSMDQDVDLSDEKLEEEVRSTLVGFADYLMDNFFLPCKPWSDTLLYALLYTNLS